MEERWLPIPGYDGYEVSDRGRIRSYWRNGQRKGLPKSAPGGYKVSTPRPRALCQDGYGYLICSIKSNSTGRSYPPKVHRLVALAFHGPPPVGKYMATHINGVKTDNRAANIRWASRSTNYADSVRHGTAASGERSGRAKLTEEQVRQIRDRYAAGGVTFRSLAHEFGVAHGTMVALVHRRSWKHID